MAKESCRECLFKNIGTGIDSKEFIIRDQNISNNLL